ncbi:ABC transporter ATP-binding protein [Agrobacterium vitis]|uniref:ABC transporter ATP-binding protein n=1 Tax=Agrobacterium vitis TaxID=373 RepID=UPI0015735866|nr:ABC transporter ATP-binding protein [Agrobacterium vitis]NSZ19460.1 ABC transporter ATP-binding protein [Agrobacterium vitis]QZO07162.1 ABC transporter ATP-binding protein [Agrobacterium vitis]UJL91258.1 ABC transporter ATP-binding protein [Agrobacterium vitis]
MPLPNALLSVRDLAISYRNNQRSGRAVDGLDFDLAPGEALALVGESGCGKSSVALSLLDLLPRSTTRTGQVLFNGSDLAVLPAQELHRIRGREIGMIFQEPMTSLNPVYTVGRQIAEILQEHTSISRRAARFRAIELLDLVSLADPATKVDAYPHELSGGQRQRVMIAMAVALEPRLLIADEPTTALDATTQAQILALIDRLRREMGTSLLLISHDLPLVRRWTDRVIVMHHGKQMELLPAAAMFEGSHHPYTRGLIAASVRLNDGRHASTQRLSEVHARRQPDGEFRFDLETPHLSQPALRNERAGSEAIFEVSDLCVSYPGAKTPAVNGVSLTIGRGETLGLVGESGSGKSSLSRAVMGLIPFTGDVRLDGHSLGKGFDQAARRRVQMVFQDPYASLNPRHTVAEILSRPMKLHGLDNREARLRQMLDLVKLPAGSADRLPHEFSGGQRQRIGIARALILKPDVVICDEAVSALDVSIQAQILNLLADLKQELGLSILFISHDLAVVQYVSDRVMVMRNGDVVETANRHDIWASPQHPYTRQLIAAAA